LVLCKEPNVLGKRRNAELGIRIETLVIRLLVGSQFFRAVGPVAKIVRA
jgi:hypothetical protein